MSVTTIVPSIRLLRKTGPASEPVTVAAAKKQLEIADSDTSHDTHLTDAIVAAREQVEQDTQYICMSQTYEAILDCFPRLREPIVLPLKPISALTSITYMDGSTQETLATTVADLDRRKRVIALKYEQEWPSVETQSDSIVITLTAGFANQNSIPRLIRQAVLLQVSKWFEDRDMLMGQTAQNFDIAYDAIIARLARSSYP